MKIKLYPCFNHLSVYNNIWVYSDPHFGDLDLYRYRRLVHVPDRRDYKGDVPFDEFVIEAIKEADEKQVVSINSCVGKKDAIIFLGDIGDTQYIKWIKGYKILIMGNHDGGPSNYQRVVENGIDNHLFDEVYSGIVMLNDKLLLSHERVSLPFTLNIHGHNHAEKIADSSGLSMNVCAEHIDYKPINLNRLAKDGVFKDIPSIHRITIDKASMRDEYDFSEGVKNPYIK